MKRDDLTIVVDHVPNESFGIALGKSPTMGDIGRVSIYRFNGSHKRIVGQLNPSGWWTADETTAERLRANMNAFRNCAREDFGITIE